MKALISAALMVATLSLSLGAHAIYNPNWERPILSAKVTVSGTVAGLRMPHPWAIAITKRDGQRNPTGFNISFPGYKPESVQFTILKATPAQCQTTEYEAIQLNADSTPGHSYLKLKLVDWSKSPCEIALPGVWLAQLDEIKDGAVVGKIHMHGNPEPVITIQ